MPFATCNGLTLHYLSQGAGEDVPLVFVNSLGTDLHLWDEIVPHFVDGRRILRYDKRGHGLSDCPPAPYSIGDHARDLAGLLDHLTLTYIQLVGISVGGMIALEFASTWPGRVKSLVVADTGAVIGTAGMWNERIAALRERGMASMVETILARWFVPDFARKAPAVYRGYANMLGRTPLEGYVGTCQAIRDADLTEAARSIQAPTLVLCGAEDMATPPDLGRKLAALVPGASYRNIPGAAHLICVEQPAPVVEEMRRFL